MDEYFDIGIWFGVPAFVITWVGCVIYAISEYGWFLGTPLGFFIGGFFAALAGFLSALLWPLLAIVIVWIVLEFV